MVGIESVLIVILVNLLIMVLFKNSFEIFLNKVDMGEKEINFVCV